MEHVFNFGQLCRSIELGFYHVAFDRMLRVHVIQSSPTFVTVDVIIVAMISVATSSSIIDCLFTCILLCLLAFCLCESFLFINEQPCNVKRSSKHFDVKVVQSLLAWHFILRHILVKQSLFFHISLSVAKCTATNNDAIINSTCAYIDRKARFQ